MEVAGESRPFARWRTVAFAVVAAALLAVTMLGMAFPNVRASDAADPEPWGSDHVGEPVPEYITGDECLFCHRATIGNAWGGNRHQRTIREAGEDPWFRACIEHAGEAKELASEAALLLGSGKRAVRLLKPNGRYNQLALLSSWLAPADDGGGKWIQQAGAHWEEQRFADKCAGCHATAVDPENRAYSALSLDCFVCHGEVDVEHTKEPSLALLNAKEPGSPKVITSICAQCHLRGGRSKSAGTPYPNNFVAGDNLFRDFEYDFAQAAIDKLDPNERHVVENIRDVALLGKQEVTCLTCHDVHKSSSKKHRILEETDACATCHELEAPKSEPLPFAKHNKTCEY